MTIKMCIDCRHAHWPTHSPGECHAPTVPPDTTTHDARAKDGICGHDATFWERNNDQTI